jgi:hypothetical protein
MATSRYTVMNESTVTEGTTGEAYPDCLTIEVNKLKSETNTVEHTLTSIDVSRPDVLISEYYGEGRSYAKDFLFIFNGIKTMWELETEQVIKILNKSDIDKFIRKYKK